MRLTFKELSKPEQMSEFPKEDFQLDLALVEETLQEYLRTGDIHSDNVALLFPTTPRVYKGGIHTEDNTYKAFKAFIDHPALGKSLILASQKLLERTKKSKSETPKDIWEVVQDSVSFFDLVHEDDGSPFRLVLKKFFGGRSSYYDLERVFMGIPEGSYSQRRFAEVMKPHFEAQDKTKWVHKIDFNDKAFHDLPPDYFTDRKFFKRILTANPTVLRHISDDVVLSDGELMLAAMKGAMKPFSARSFKPLLRDDVFAKFSPTLKADKSFIHEVIAIGVNAGYINAIGQSAVEIRDDVEFAVELLQKFGKDAARYHLQYFSAKVRNSSIVAELASPLGGFQYLTKECRSNVGYATRAISWNPVYITYCEPELWDEPKVLNAFRSQVASSVVGLDSLNYRILTSKGRSPIEQRAFDILGLLQKDPLEGDSWSEVVFFDFQGANFHVSTLFSGDSESLKELQVDEARAVAIEFLARGGDEEMVKHLFPEGLGFVEGMRAARKLRQKKFEKLLAELKSTDWLELYKSAEIQDSVPEERPQKIAGLGLESSAQKFFGVDEAGVIHLEEWVMDANSAAEINRFESFEGTVTETEIAVSDSADHSGRYLFRQTVSEVEGAPCSQFALEIGEGDNVLEVSGARAIELFGILLVSRNPQLEAGFNLLGFSFSQGGTWDWLCEWFAMSFCDLKFKSGRPPELRREERLDEYDDLDGDGDEVIYYHTTTHDENGEVFGIVMCSSGNQPLGLAFLTNDWEDTVYSLN